MSEEQEFEVVALPVDCLPVDDGQIILLDWADFATELNCLAVRRKGAVIEVLPRDTLKWVNVETVKRPKLESVP